MIRGVLWACVGLALAGEALAWLCWDALPAEMPIHWGPSGQSDDWMPRAWATHLGPALSLAVSLVVVGLMRLDPRQAHVARSRTAIDATLLGLGAFGLGIQAITLQAATRPDQALSTSALGVMVGLLFPVLGNVMPKARSNWFFGIRTPWTLSSEAVWHRTHRVGGWSLALAGGVILGASLTLQGPALLGVLLTASLLGSLVPVVYSYLTFRHEGGEGSEHAPS